MKTLRPGMTTPVVRRCPDGHFRRVIYDLAAYIADYPEQVLLAGIVQGWCPRFVAHLLSDTSFSPSNRCTALPNDLDGIRGHRNQALTELLMDTLTSKELRDEFGIDDDVIVCFSLLLPS